MFNVKIAAALAVASLALSPVAFAQDAAPQVDEAAQEQARADAEALATPSTEGVVTDEASCTYEGGNVEQLSTGTICLIPMRGEALGSQFYDGQGFGVLRCEGNGEFANEPTPGGSFCRVYLTEKIVPKTREEIEAELAAQTAAALAEGAPDASN
ncbi:MAG: hypothetical protein AAF926_06490 [Pseudomonadota bacterium]